MERTKDLHVRVPVKERKMIKSNFPVIFFLPKSKAPMIPDDLRFGGKFYVTFSRACSARFCF